MPFQCHQSLYFVARSRGGLPLFSNPAAAQRLRTSVRRAQLRHAFVVDALAFNDNAVLTMWTLGDAQTDYRRIWRYVRADFSRWHGATTAQRGQRVVGKVRSPWQSKLHTVEVADSREYGRLLVYLGEISAGRVC